MPIPARPELLGAVVLLLVAAFVASGWIRPRFRIWWRRALIIAYSLVLGLVLVWITIWAIGLLKLY
jgi:hypothetical protein